MIDRENLLPKKLLLLLELRQVIDHVFHFFFSGSREKYDRRSERSCDSPRSHHRLHYGGHRRSPSPNSTNLGRYKPSTQAISPPRDSFSEGEGKHSSYIVGDLRDSLNRSKESRNSNSGGGGGGNNSSSSAGHRYHRSYPDRLKDPRSRRYSDLRGLSPNSSGDEKDYLRKKLHPPDSGLSSEDHASTGSSGSSSGPPLLSDHHHERHHSGSTPASSSYRSKHLKSAAGKDPVPDKVRRSSTDSARSSTTHHDDLDLIYGKNSGSSSTAGLVAGADDVSDGSRPGTPLCDERPQEHNSHHHHHNSHPSRLRSSEPMSLPLPKFATQMLASQIQSSSSYLTAKKDPRLKSPPTSNSAFDRALSVSTCLKSPPTASVSLKSPASAAATPSSRIIPEQQASANSATLSENLSNSKPHDPRLAATAIHAANSAATASIQRVNKPNSLSLIKNSSLMNDIEDISDSDREEEEPKEDLATSNEEKSKSENDDPTNAANAAAKSEEQPASKENKESQNHVAEPVQAVQDPANMSLEERLKAFDEKYQKWSGTASNKPGQASTAPGPVALPALKIPTAIVSTPSSSGGSAASAATTAGTSDQTNSSASEKSTAAPPSAATNSLASSSGSSALNSASSASSLAAKFSFDLKPTQPSPIVQQLLARKSVFDEDSKRLENLNTMTDGIKAEGSGSASPVLNNHHAHHHKESKPIDSSSLMSVGSVNFGYNTISTLNNPGSNSTPVMRSMSVDHAKLHNPPTPTAVRPMLTKMNSVMDLKTPPSPTKDRVSEKPACKLSLQYLISFLSLFRY